jgi:hypothetical protein
MWKNGSSAGATCQITERRCRLGGSARVPYGDTDMIAYMKLGCNITAAARSISLLGAEYE